jgi:hypothetical protein
MAIRKATLASRWMSVSDISARLTQARDNRERQRKLLDTLEGQAMRRREEIERSLADLPSSHRGQLVSRAVGGFRGELKRASADERLKLVRDIGRLREETQAVREHYGSAAQLLAREGLGSERRSRLQQQVEKSGSAELAAFAAFAAVTKDKELGAVLCARVSDLMPNERPFNRQELAEALVGDEHRAVTQALMEIDRLAEETAHADSAFERGSANLIRTLGIARMKRDEADIGADLSLLETEPGHEG